MKKLILVIFIILISGLLFEVSAEQQPKVTVINYGRYIKIPSKAGKGAGTAGNVWVRRKKKEIKHIETTKRIPCKIGEFFGFNFEITNLPKKRSFTFRAETHHPPFKLPDGKVERISSRKGRHKWAKRLRRFEGWVFLKGYEYELVPGNWTKKIFINGVEVLSMTFEVYVPDK